MRFGGGADQAEGLGHQNGFLHQAMDVEGGPCLQEATVGQRQSQPLACKGLHWAGTSAAASQGGHLIS